jgi:hypothetical protein
LQVHGGSYAIAAGTGAHSPFDNPVSSKVNAVAACRQKDSQYADAPADLRQPRPFGTAVPLRRPADSGAQLRLGLLSSRQSFFLGRRHQSLVAAALILVALFARTFALRAQDRVIRLEMRLRLRELLPAALQPRIGEFTPVQLIAMRFASDQELPSLAERVLADRITDRRTIKKLIVAWEADHLRV